MQPNQHFHPSNARKQLNDELSSYSQQPTSRKHVPWDRMRFELRDLDPGFGWHTEDDQFRFHVVRNPDLYRIHKSTEYNVLSTWIEAED